MNSINFYNLFFSNFADIASSDRLLVSMGAILLVSIIGYVTGPISGNANPMLWILLDRLFGVGRKSYKLDRSSSSLSFRGVLFGFLYILTAAALGAGAYYIIKHHAAFLPLEILLLSFLLSGGGVWLSLTKLYQALKEGSRLEKGSYRPIAVSTRSDLNTTDDYGIARVGIGYMPKVFDKALVAPLFWYLVGGLPLAYLYAGIACAAWALSKEGFARNFGDFILRLETLFGFLPHIIAGIFMMAAALFTPTAQMSRVFPLLIKWRGRARYAEGGFPLTVTAYALNVSLGGPVQDLDGSVIKHGWIGPPSATAKVDKGHLKRAVYMSVMGYVLVFAALVAGLLAWKLTGYSYN